MGTLTCKLPYGNEFSIVSPCNGATLETYARIYDVDGLNSSLSTVSAIERVGLDGALYTGSAKQYKTLTVSIDVSDHRITWTDLYSFFNKCTVYKLVFTNYYVLAAISQFKRNFFEKGETLIVTFECSTPYWCRDFSVLNPIVCNGENPVTFTVPDYGTGDEVEADFTFIISDMIENSVKGFYLAPVGYSADRYLYDITLNTVYTPLTGATWYFRPNKDGYVVSAYMGRTARIKVDGYPNPDKVFLLGHDYQLTLKQGVANTKTSVTFMAKGIIRSYL